MSIRVNRRLRLKDRKICTFGNFRGIDFSSSPYSVLQNRATSAKNLIYSNGLVRKRNGWKSLLKLPDRINGVYSFELNDDKFVFVYAGTRFYLLEYNDDLEMYEAQEITNTCTYDKSRLVISNLIDRRIQIYVNKNKAYIVGCGDYLVFAKYGTHYELRRVCDNEDTYMPTTTINIDADTVIDANRASFDKVNILSSYRKNEMVGLDASNGTWTVDTASIDTDSDISIMLEIAENGTIVEKLINNRLETNRSGLYMEGNDTEEIGTVNFTNGKITLNINTKPPEAGTSNMIIVFKKAFAEQTSIIENATASIVFGSGGNSNRLFLGGSPEYKNVHMWSEMYDFSYFADTNYDEVGSDSSAIMGYVRATDGVLLIFKEKNGNDATTYYIRGVDEEGQDISFETRFYKTAGNISDTILAKSATASLNGDNLILTNNGVKGLALIDNLSTSAYRAQERSRNVNAKLLKEDNLEEACGFVFQDKYYLAVNDAVYVCSSAFTFRAEDTIGNSFDYEWWYLDSINARVWCEIENKLFFGTNDGKLCVVTDEFADVSYQYISANNLTLSSSNDKVAYNIALDSTLKENDTIRFVNGDVYALYIDSDVLGDVDTEGNISFMEELLPKIYDGVQFYVDRVAATGLEIDVLYKIKDVNLDNLTFRIVDTAGNIVIPTATTFRMCKKISNKELYITNIDTVNNEFQIREYLRSEPIDLIYYNGIAPTQICAYLCFKQNIVAEWYSPICDMGSNMYSKTLLGLTVATEPLMRGSIQIGFQTRNTEKYFSVKGNRGFDFDDIDFENFSFEGSFVTSKTIRCKERNFNFIVLRYISDSQTSCAVSSITMQYKINNLNKGVR